MTKAQRDNFLSINRRRRQFPLFVLQLYKTPLGIKKCSREAAGKDKLLLSEEEEDTELREKAK